MTDESAAHRRHVVADVDDKATQWRLSHQAAASRRSDSHDKGGWKRDGSIAGLPELDIGRLTAHLRVD